MPSNFSFTTSRSIKIVYDATGRKWRKTTSDGNTKDYISGVEYLNGNFEALYTSEGRMTQNGATYRYEYSLKDERTISDSQSE